MNPELELIAKQLNQAGTLEEVFGEITGADPLLTIKKRYHDLVKMVHPDLFTQETDKKLAHFAFGQLSAWFKAAEEKIQLGAYAPTKGGHPQVILQTSQGVYRIDDEPIQGEVFNSYPCSFEKYGHIRRAMLKITRKPQNNDLLQNEIAILRTLLNSPDAKKFSAYLPGLLDAFVYQDKSGEHQAAVLNHHRGWYSLEDIRHAYPSGINPKDMAWMFRRLLVALGFAHRNGVVHNAVLPSNVWILPEYHGLMLTNWTQATCESLDGGINALSIDPAYRNWYPSEVLNGAPPSAQTDIRLSVKCMLFLLGGDPVHRRLPDSVPNPLKAFFKGSLLPGKAAPGDAWALKGEFDELIERFWGKRKFHLFVMK